MAFDIIRTWELTPDGEPLEDLDNSKLVLDPDTCTLHLKPDDDGHYFIGLGNYRAQLANVKIGCMGSIKGLVLDAEYGDIAGARYTGFRFRLRLNNTRMMHNGSAWVEGTGNEPWIEAESINPLLAGITPQQLEQYNYTIGFEIQPYTPDPTITPHLRSVGMVYTANPEPNVMEGLLYRSLIPKLKGVDAPVDVVFDTTDTEQASITLDDIANRCGIKRSTIRGIEACSLWDDANGKPGAYFGAYYDGVGSIVSAGTPFAASTKYWMRLMVEPMVVIDSANQDYVEGESVPSIVISNITTDNVRPAVGRDFARPEGQTYGGIQKPQVTSLDFTLMFTASMGTELARFIERANRGLNNSPYMYSEQLGERYRFRILGNTVIGGGDGGSKLPTATVACRLENISLIGPSIYSQAVTAFHINGDLTATTHPANVTGRRAPICNLVKSYWAQKAVANGPVTVGKGEQIYCSFNYEIISLPPVEVWLQGDSGAKYPVTEFGVNFIPFGPGVGYTFGVQMTLPDMGGEYSLRPVIMTAAGVCAYADDVWLQNRSVAPPMTSIGYINNGQIFWSDGYIERVNVYQGDTLDIYGGSLDCCTVAALVESGTDNVLQYLTPQLTDDMFSHIALIAADWRAYKDVSIRLWFGFGPTSQTSYIDIPLQLWPHAPNAIEMYRAPAILPNYGVARVLLRAWDANGAPVTGAQLSAWAWEVWDGSQWAPWTVTTATGGDTAGSTQIIQPGAPNASPIAGEYGLIGQDIPLPALPNDPIIPVGSRVRCTAFTGFGMSQSEVSANGCSFEADVVPIAKIAIDYGPEQQDPIDPRLSFGIVASDTMDNPIEVSGAMWNTDLEIAPGFVEFPYIALNGRVRWRIGQQPSNGGYNTTRAVLHAVLVRFETDGSPVYMSDVYMPYWDFPPNP